MSQNIGTPWIYKETLVWQLTKHIKNPEEYDNIFPMREWTLQEYRQIFYLIHKGWLVQSSENVGFIVNPEWEGEPLWECEEEETEEEEELKWKYIKEYLNYEWGHSNSIKIKDIYEIAYEYDENEGGISVDMKGKECRDEDLNDYIQRKITPELFDYVEKTE